MNTKTTRHPSNTTRRTRPARRGGFALLMCLFVLFMVSVWLMDMLTSQTIHTAAIRNIIEYEQALYLANAGLHHAAAEVETDDGWRGTVSDGGYPASGSYEATVVNGVAADTVDVSSVGVSGEVTRRLEATISVN